MVTINFLVSNCTTVFYNWHVKYYLARLRFNFRRILTSGVSPGKELLVLIFSGDVLDKLANPRDATTKQFLNEVTL